MASFTLTVNGARKVVNVAADTPLLYVLRNDLQLSGPRLGCGMSQCGSCAVLADTSVSCWGSNVSGELGNGTTRPSSIPVHVKLVTKARGVSAGGWSSCAMLSDGTAKCWGDDTHGQVGAFLPGKRQLTASTIVPRLTGVLSISTGIGHSCAVLTVTSAKCWGSNQFGQLGNGQLDDSPNPVVVSST